MTDEQWWSESAPVLARFIDDARFPVAARRQSKVALVTGANRGLGLEIARGLAEQATRSSSALATRGRGRRLPSCCAPRASPRRP